MTTTTIKKQNLRYYDLDFQNLWERFKEFAKTHYVNTYRDFSKASAGTMLAEFICLVGDINNLRVDHVYGELIGDDVTEPKTLYKMANSEGFEIPGKAPASGPSDFYITVPSTLSGSVYVPDLDYAITLKRGSRCFKGGQAYELTEDIKFSDVNFRNKAQSVVSSRDTYGNPSFYALKLPGDIVAGETKTHQVAVGSYEPYRVITLPDSNISQILGATDSEGNTWYKVSYLAQNTVFVGEENTADDQSLVTSLLKARPAPYRFVVRRNPISRKLELHFGAGDSVDATDDIVPNVGDLALPLYGKSDFTDPFIDPQNFLKTKTLGMAPVNTTFTIRYRVGGGKETNAAVGEVNVMGEVKYSVSSTGLDADKLAAVLNSVAVENSYPIEGGSDGLSMKQLKHMLKAFTASQLRCVSIPDYEFKAYSMPSEFGSVFRASARRNPFNKHGVQLYILGQDKHGNLQNATNTLKTNVQTFFKNTTQDSVDLMDVHIINLGIMFSVVVQGRNKQDVLAECIQKLKDHFDINKWQISQPIVISKLSDLLDDVNGVYSVAQLRVVNLSGTQNNRSYSTRTFNVEEHTTNGIIIPGDNVIFEVKYLNHDILGRAI